MEELDWSAERQVLIPAEHFWCDFKCRPWAKNSSPNTNDLHSLYGQKYWDTPFFRREKGTSELWQQRWKHNLCTYTFVFPPLLQQFGSVCNDCTHMYKSLVFGYEFLAQGLYLKSHQKCSAEIRTWLSADQSSSSTLTESSFLSDPCLIHRGTVMLDYKRVLSKLLL